MSKIGFIGFIGLIGAGRGHAALVPAIEHRSGFSLDDAHAG